MQSLGITFKDLSSRNFLFDNKNRIRFVEFNDIWVSFQKYKTFDKIKKTKHKVLNLLNKIF
jgi:hypothetical protein